MLLLGLILFVFLLILFWRGVVWFAGKIGKAKGQEQKYRKYTAYLGIFIAVATILFFIADEIYTKKQFEQLCKKEAGLKVYKKVDNVDGFLYMSDENSNPEYYKQFKFYENVDRENRYKIKEYYTKKQSNKYVIDYFVIMTERKYLGHGKFSETLKKESKINFNDFKIDRYTFVNNEEYSTEENVAPKSRYIFLRIWQRMKKFGAYKVVIIDKKDYSIVAEKVMLASGGGKFSEFLGSFYGGSYVGDCGRDKQDLIKQIFQSNVQ